ncbi:MAG: DUF3108 domain-containing protein [Nitrospirae bacterium]|nr:DUF3108 domain-containing protein [Nitrospirota bacterium]
MIKCRSQRSKVKSQKFKKLVTRHSLLVTVFLLFTVHCSLFTYADAASPVTKKFVYYVFWSGIRAGTAVLYYESAPEGVIIKTHATSAALISLFYKVDDFAQSAINQDGYPKSFILKVSEGFHKRDKATYFEEISGAKPHKIIYHNIRDDEKVEFYFDKPAYDPLSAFHAITKRDLKVGRSEYIDIFDSEKLYNTEVQVLKKEKIRVLAGEFDTILVKPLLKSEGIFRKTGDMFIWATDDENKLPVLMKSKAAIGTFTVELVEGDF